MNTNRLREILEGIHHGRISVLKGMEELKLLTTLDLGFARIDRQRSLRCGFPEVVFCSGKSPEQVETIAKALMKTERKLLATRASETVFGRIQAHFRDAVYHREASAVTIGMDPLKKRKGRVLVISAGTSDIPVAEETRVTAEMGGSRVETLYDVGVAGIHRLFEERDRIHRAKVIVVVAGMEGALASVVGGLVDKPVIGVPTSVGYGASFGGVAALLSMLNSCASGVTVVNIDNGFGAGYFASLVNLGWSK